MTQTQWFPMFTPKATLEHADSRGEIFSITLPDNRDGSKLLLLHSNAGALRGGHSHDVDEVVTLLSGKMKYHKRVSRDEWDMIEELVEELTAGMSSFSPAGETHMAEFLEDSWVLECKFTTPGVAWSNTDYEPWRERVRTSTK